MSGANHVLSPATTSCWSDEDYIERIARLSRKCHQLQLQRGTMKRALIRYRNEWKDILRIN